MAEHRVGVIMNGVTGRMGRNQHLARSIAAIRSEGGIQAGDTLIWPEPLLLGRDAERLRQLAVQHGIERWSTDLDSCLSDPGYTVYFDAQTTNQREQAVRRAVSAGKHVYCEKPVATTSAAALGLAELAESAGVRNGVVEDMLFLPGLVKLAAVLHSGLIGRVLAARIDFGYWVFEDANAQRPSWNYRKEDGGGIVLDMFCHFRYLLDRLIGDVSSVTCTIATHIPEREDEHGKTYAATADDAAYALVEIEGGPLVQVNASWAVRPYRDELLTVQVDGTLGSAVAGLLKCRVQPTAVTPRFVWNPDAPVEPGPRSCWIEVPDRMPTTNAFRRQWELFLRHVVVGEDFPWDIRDGARGVQLAESALRSAAERRTLAVPKLARA